MVRLADSTDSAGSAGSDAASAPSLAPFYASPTYRGEAAGYGYIRTPENFAHTRLEIGWQGAPGYYRQTGTQGKKVPSRPSRFGLWEVGRKVAVPLALTLASPTSLSPLLLAPLAITVMRHLLPRMARQEATHQTTEPDRCEDKFGV